jgi:hypothetical protein
VGIAVKAHATHVVEVMKLPLHVVEGGLRRPVCVEKFSDDTRLAVPVFIEIDMVGGLNPVYSEIRSAIYSYLRENIVAKILIKGIVPWEMAEVLHEKSYLVIDQLFDALLSFNHNRDNCCWKMERSVRCPIKLIRNRFLRFEPKRHSEVPHTDFYSTIGNFRSRVFSMCRGKGEK